MIDKIVHVQAGQCINFTYIGNVCWNALSVERKLGKDGKFAANKDDAYNQRGQLVNMGVCF